MDTIVRTLNGANRAKKTSRETSISAVTISGRMRREYEPARLVSHVVYLESGKVHVEVDQLKVRDTARIIKTPRLSSRVLRFTGNGYRYDPGSSHRRKQIHDSDCILGDGADLKLLRSKSIKARGQCSIQRGLAVARAGSKTMLRCRHHTQADHRICHAASATYASDRSRA